jgi:hypothetical protein
VYLLVMRACKNVGLITLNTLVTLITLIILITLVTLVTLANNSSIPMRASTAQSRIVVRAVQSCACSAELCVQCRVVRAELLLITI